MRLAVHDFSGHPFQIQLSRELARRGYEVLHLHCPSYVSGKGALARTAEDSPLFSVDGVALDQTFEKYSPVRRFLHERIYGKRVVDRLHSFRPDVVLSSNAPLFSQQILLESCRAAGWRFIFWQQDIYSLGMQSAVAHIPLLGRQLGRYATRLEARLLAGSDAVVVISEDFIPTLHAWGVQSERIEVIHNWAPLDELPVVGRENPWSIERGLTGKVVYLYSGTLGRKHNPNLLLALARRFRDRPEIVIIVASEGADSSRLKAQAADEHLMNLEVLGFQPYGRLAEVLASGDVLLVILDEEAGIFSVPSKVLSYQCAGKPILASLPPENLASRIIQGSNCGIAVSPNDEAGFLDAAERLSQSESLRLDLGANSRHYAEETFAIDAIGDRFENVLQKVCSNL